MNRRSFFRRVGTAVAAWTLSSKLGMLAPAPPTQAAPGLYFPPEAFEMVTRMDIIYGWTVLRPDQMVRIEG